MTPAEQIRAALEISIVQDSSGKRLVIGGRFGDTALPGLLTDPAGFVEDYNTTLDMLIGEHVKQESNDG